MKFSVDRDEFKSLIDMASELNEVIPIEIEENQLVIKMYDIGHTRGLRANFVLDDMKDFEPIELGLQTEVMARKLTSAHSGKIKCEVKKGMFIIKQEVAIAKINLKQEHRLFYIDDSALEVDGVKLPDQEITGLTTFIKIPNASAIKSIFQNIHTEFFDLRTTDTQFIIEAKGMGEGSESEFTLDVPVSNKKDSGESRYLTDSIKSVVKYLPSGANISLKFGKDRPLVVNSMGDKTTIEIIFAPIVE